MVGVRPDKLAYGSAPPANSNLIRVPFMDQAFLGSKLLLHFRAAEGDVVLGEAPATLSQTFNAGDTVDIHWPVEDTLVFPLADK